MAFGIFFELTNACNLRCRTCLPSSAFPRPNEMTKEMIAAAAACLREHGAESVYISGGEPFIRADAGAILDAFGSLGYRLTVVSNGLLLDNAVIAVLARHGATVSISLDGACATTNDRIRGDGAFAGALAAIRTLRRRGVEVAIGVTVTRGNYNEIADIARLAASLGVERITYSEVVHAGRAVHHWPQLGLTDDQRAMLVDAVLSAARETFGSDMLADDDRCWVDGSSLYVNAEGSAYLCSELWQQTPERSIGDIRNSDGVAAVVAAMGQEHGHRACCYQIIATPNVTLIANLARPCALVELKLEVQHAID